MTKCPYCGHSLDAASTLQADGRVPQADDCAVCLSCAQILVFDGFLVPRKARPGELVAFYQSQRGLEAAHQKVQRLVRGKVN